MKTLWVTVAIFTGLIILGGCKKDDENILRDDKAVKLDINLSGSLQNAAFSPDGKSIVFTRFRKGYNKPPSDLYIYNLETKALRELVSDGSSNVNLPGESWNDSTYAIIFSSDRGPHDEIYSIAETGTPGDEKQITSRTDSVGYEPTFSPNGQWIVFESHKMDQEGKGVITKYKTDGSSSYMTLTAFGRDCRQPNWSPTGNKILYQYAVQGQWDIWGINPNGTGDSKITNFDGSKTDAVFTPDGQYIIFSMENEAINMANIFKSAVTGANAATQLTNYRGYDGAPSISPDGKTIIFESSSKEPDKSDGTSLWMLDL